MKSKILLAFLSALVALSARAISITTAGSPYTQDFDAPKLAASGTANVWANDTTIPGWSLFRQPAPGTVITAYDAGTGSSTAGSFYSFGSAGSGERSLGGLGSGGAYFGSPSAPNIAGWITAAFVNSSGGALDGFTANWNGEQWRNGGSTSAQTMDFEYGFGATFGAVVTWNSTGSSFDFTSPVHTSTAGALDGNIPANQVTGIGGTITGLTWANGDKLWLRWLELNDTGNDHGLAIDNFSFTAQAPTAVPDTGTTAILLSIPLLGFWTLRRLTTRLV